MSKTDLQNAARALAAARLTKDPDHPETLDLAAYHAGELDDEERDRIRRHLVVCSACARRLLELAQLPEVEPATPASTLPPAELDRRWERLRDELRREAAPAQAPPAQVLTPFPARPIRPDGFTALRFYQAAAALLLVVAGALLAVVLAGDRSPTGTGAGVNVWIAELAPVDAGQLRTGAGDQRIVVPARADAVVVTLALADPRTFPAYEVEVRQLPDGEVRWQTSSLQRLPGGVLTFTLPRRLLPAGSYQIALRGLDGARREPLAEYAVRLEYEPAAP